jgi:trigger factor
MEALNLEDIQAQITTVDEITRKAVVSVPASQIDSEYKAAIKKYSSRAKVNGFRPGKAPVAMIEQMYGDSLRWDAVSKLVSDSLQKVVQKNELQMVGTPKIDITSNKPGSDLEFTADFSIYPTPTITGYDSISIEVEKEELTDDAVNKVIDSIRRSRATVQPTDRKMVQSDDVIDVSVVFKAKDGSETAAETATIGLGDGRLPKEFDDQVIGMQVGETREVRLASGEEGELNYSVTLNSISERVLPELTDEFVASLNEEAKTVKDLKDRISANLTSQFEAQANEKAKNVVVEKLIELNPFQIPQSMIDDEIRNLLIRVGAVDPNNTKFEDIPADPFRDSFGEMATKRVKANIVLDQVAQKENITPNDEDMKKAFQEIAAQSRITEAEARRRFTGRSMLHLAVEITRSKTQDVLIEKAKISYTPKKSEK